MKKNLIPAGILGVAAYIPQEIRTNDYWDGVDFGPLKPGKDPFKGISERRVIPENILPTDVEAEVGIRALEASGLKPKDVDLVMVQSMTPEEILPGDACRVQYKMGLKNAGAWNVDTCCSSFVTMVVMASNLIATGEFNNILIIASACITCTADKNDYLSIPMGDGAGAVVMGRVSEGRGYVASFCDSHGKYHKGFTVKLRQPKGYQRSHFMPSQEKAYLTFQEDITREVGKNSIDDMKRVLNKVLEKSHCTSKDIGLFLSHQPCHWAHDAWRDSIGIPPQKSYQTFEKYGNIASATIPINLFEALNLGMLKDDDYLLIASPGAGANHIAAILRWGK